MFLCCQGAYNATALYILMPGAVDCGCTCPYAAQGDIFSDSFPLSEDGISQRGADPVGVAFLPFPCTYRQVSSNVTREERIAAPMNVTETESPTANPQLQSMECQKYSVMYACQIILAILISQRLHLFIIAQMYFISFKA